MISCRLGFRPGFTISLLFFAVLTILAAVEIDAQKRGRASQRKTTERSNRRADDPGDEENLNRELWEFASQTPYEQITKYVAAEQLKSRATVPPEVELPNGWRIRPAGTQVPVGRLPYSAIMFAGHLVVLDTGYYHHEPQEVSVIDPASATVTKIIKLNSIFPSATVGGDGDLYISGGFDERVYRVNRDFNIVREYRTNGFTSGIVALDATHLAVGCMAVKNAKGTYLNGNISILNTTTGAIEKERRLGYFPFDVRHVGNRIYVAALGENQILSFTSALKPLKTFPVGQTPQDMCADGRDLFVVNQNSDSVSVIDTKTDQIIANISLAMKGSKFGVAPTGCAVDGNHLFVTLSNTNELAEIDINTHKQLGLIPTGWYPTSVTLAGNQLFITNAKGITPRRPNPTGPQAGGPSRVAGYVLTLLQGSVSIVSRGELDRNLKSWTNIAEASAPIFDVHTGFRLPIRYIFYIIKENRTYDQVFGDIAGANGDPKLAILNASITPVHHELAKQFVTLDNFYANGEISVLGHSFTTSGYVSPFAQWFGNVSYSYRWKGYPFGMVPAVTSPAYLWDALDARNVDYRIYGENYFLFTRAYKICVELYGEQGELTRRYYDKVVDAAGGSDRGHEFTELASPYYGQANTRADAYRLLGNPKFANALSIFLTGNDLFARYVANDERLRQSFADYLYHYPFNFHSWDLSYSDMDRARDWKTDFDTQVRLGHIAQLQYIWLPNDHTDGASKKILDAYQFIAQNDTALGQVVDTIAKSPIWKESLILVEEDDAQNGPDHVDATRTVALAAGPYVKRGAIINDRYDQLSMLRTIEVLLGLNPLSSGDRLAVPMFGIFTDKPDFRPFVAPEPSNRLAPSDRAKLAAFR